jgi:hypothetical protein
MADKNEILSPKDLAKDAGPRHRVLARVCEYAMTLLHPRPDPSEYLRMTHRRWGVDRSARVLSQRRNHRVSHLRGAGLAA